MRIRTLGLAALGGVFCIEGYSGFPLEIGLGFPRAFFRRDVRFGSLADIVQRRRHVCFTPESRHSSARIVHPLCTISGHLQKQGAELGFGVQTET
jgi:hypothetical protein